MIAFYVFMLIVSLLIPVCMLCFGYRWQKKAPEKINYTYGYRTKRSMSSKRAWEFAHKHCGRLWVKCGWFTAILTVGFMIALSLISIKIEIVSIVTLVLVCLQMFPMISPLVITEHALKREFGA